MFRKLKFLIVLAVASFALFSSTVSDASPTSQAVTLTGTFTILWGDPAPGSGGAPTINYLLSDDRGNITEILLSQELARAHGGVLALNRARVTVTGVIVPNVQRGPAQLRVEAILSREPESRPELVGNKPWISIGCKFADVATEPKSPQYLRDMYSSDYPGLDHYWRQVSLGQISTSGSTAVAWLTLPKNKAAYTQDSTLKLVDVAQDCASAADAQIDFRNYFGVNFMLNDVIGWASWGTTGLYMNRDGEIRMWPATWLLPWAYTSIAVTEHEMGHGFGLPHSSGNYGLTYDNQWDVMSDTSSNCERAMDPIFGCLGQHTIADNKQRLMNLLTLTLAPNSQQTILLENLETLQGSNYKQIQIPIGDSTTHYYTVEARHRLGYDGKLPGEGVIIHEVDTTWGNPAHVIDIDDNNNTGDAGAIWSPGEIFGDSAHKIYVCIHSDIQTGFNVTASRGVVPGCAANPTPTNTPRPGNITATGAQMHDNFFKVQTVFKQDEHTRPFGSYQNTSGSTQTVRLDYDIVGPCGPIYHTHVKQYTALYPNGSEDVGARIPSDACLGTYTMTFGITYNTLSTASTTFTVIADDQATPTRTATRKPGSVTAYETWAEKANHRGFRVETFSPGDEMRFAGWIWNGDGSSSTTQLEWNAVGPCGLLHSVEQPWGPDEGNIGYWTVESPPYTIPPDACPGTYTNTLSVTYNGKTTASSTFTILSSGTPTKTATPTRTPTRTPTPTFTPDGNWIYCAAENQSCNLPGPRLVRFGANNQYKFQSLAGSFACTSAVFGGDPLPGMAKHCDYHANPNESAPTNTPTRTRVLTDTPTSTATATPTGTATFTSTATPTEPPPCASKPAKPRLVSPKDEALIRKGQATLKWEEAACAETYIVVVRQQLDKHQVEKAKGLTALEYQTTKLEPAHSYQWRVLAVNQHGRSASKWREMQTK